MSGGFLAEERRRLLPRLVPPLVHRLNNALAVMQGLSEVKPDHDQGGLLERELDAARTLLARLSCFARDQEPTTESFDLRELVGGVTSFLKPFAESAGIKLEFRKPLHATTLENDPLRVEQLVTVLVAQELSDLADEAGWTTERFLRLAVRQSPGRTVLTIVRPRAARGEVPPAMLSAAARWADENATALFMRTMGAATCYRFVFPSPAASTSEDLEPGYVDEPKRLLLVEGDGPLCELINTVCVEAGYDVAAASERDFDPRKIDVDSVDLVLFDVDLELRRPGLVARLERRVAGSGRLLLLGEPPDGSASATTPYLAKPFRPHELLSAVSRYTSAIV